MDEEYMPEPPFEPSEEDPVSREKREQEIDERLILQIKNSVHLEDDEIKQLFPTREKLREFAAHQKSMRSIQTLPDVEEDEEDPEDDYDLPKRERERMQRRIEAKKAIVKSRESELEEEGEKMLEAVTGEKFPKRKKKTPKPSEILEDFNKKELE
jgi:hypothetical protein